jgi:hypothetical protein
MLNDNIAPAPTWLSATACTDGPSLSVPPLHRSGLELAVEAVSLGGEGMCADQVLILAFDASTGMVASYSLVGPPGETREAARTAVEGLRELHIHKDIEIEVSCRSFAAHALVDEIRRMSGRTKVMANDGWSTLLSFDRAAAEIGRQVRAVAAHELAAGRVGCDGADESRFFLECVVDQVLYWYHRRPAYTPGFKSPIERLAARHTVGSRIRLQT